MNTLAGRMRSKRLGKGLTQDELASKSGCTQAGIQKIENGKSLRPRKIDKIAKVLGVNPAWLSFGDKLSPTLSTEALAVAKAWSSISPAQRSQLKKRILSLAKKS